MMNLYEALVFKSILYLMKRREGRWEYQKGGPKKQNLRGSLVEKSSKKEGTRNEIFGV